jgi:hypothetical protein
MAEDEICNDREVAFKPAIYLGLFRGNFKTVITAMCMLCIIQIILGHLHFIYLTENCA